MAEVTLRVEGLRALARDLRAIDGRLAKELQRANKATAAIIASGARAAYERRHRRRSGRGAASIRALASQTRAQIAFGSARAPYVIGQEFGARQHIFAQFPPWSGKGPDGRGSMGYFIYPTIRREAGKLPEAYARLLDKVLRPVFPRG